MTIRHTTPAAIPEALRLAAWLTEGAWRKMTLGDVEAAGRELRRLHALASTPVAPVAPAPQPAVPTIMRWNLLAGWGMKPAANGLYVRYEDHAAALAAAPKVDHIADASKMVPAPLQQGEYPAFPKPVARIDCGDADDGGLNWWGELVPDTTHTSVHLGQRLFTEMQMREVIDADRASRGAAQAASAVTAQGQYYDAHFATPAAPAPVAEDADPLQGAANWLVTSHATTSATELGSRLCIGYNRAERLFNAARAQAAQPEGGA